MFIGTNVNQEVIEKQKGKHYVYQSLHCGLLYIMTVYIILNIVYTLFNNVYISFYTKIQNGILY